MYTASGSKAYAQIGVESAVMSASQQHWSPCYLMEC